LGYRDLFELPQGALSIAAVATPGGRLPAAFLVSGDAASKAATAAEVLNKITAQARAEKRQVRTENFKNLTLTVIEPDAANADEPPTIWTRQDNQFYVSSNIDVLKDLLANVDGRTDNLASSPAFKVVQQKVGNQGQILWYLDLDRVIRLLVRNFADQQGANA